MRAQVVTIRNPFDGADRVYAQVRRREKVRRLAPVGRPVVAILNGRPMMRAEWRRRLNHGDHLAFVILPAGGGGGGSNPLQAILSLALLSFAPWAAAGLLGTTTALVGTTLLGQITTTAIALAGSAVISAIIPAQGAGSSFAAPAPSPTYSLTAQGNTARLEQPIPVQYGRMRFFPEFAAQPYTEFAGSEQYLYQLFCLGQGEFDVEQIQIDDTDISAFPELAGELIPPNGTVTLFPTAVSTSTEVGGQELLSATLATYSQSGTTITVNETAHGRAAGQSVSLDFTSGTATDAAFQIVSAPTANTFTVTAAASLTTSGNVTVRSMMGGVAGFTAVDSGKVASRIAVDVVLSRGLFGSSGSTLTDKTITFTIEARQMDDLGAPIGGWFFLGAETITDRTTTPIRRSYTYTMPTPGRYSVRAYRTDGKDTASTSGHEILWSGLRAYLQEPTSYGNVTLLAMRMRATNSLSLQASRLIRVTATRKVPVWNGTSWSAPVASRSIAWAFADMARNTVYGAGRPDSQIDLAALLALDEIWAARGDQFDGRFDQSSTFWAAAGKMLAAGRAKPFLQGGVLRVVRDGAASIPVAMFTMRNIVRGSFGIDYLMPNDDTADAIQVSYLDGATWTPQRVVGQMPGSTAAKPVKVDLFGVTVRNHALREATYLAASNRYRRRIVSFATEMDGFLPSLGDLIAIQHDMIGWGAQAEVVAWNAATLTMTVSEPMTFGVGDHYVEMRRKDGSASGPWRVTAGATAYQLVFTAAPDITPYAGSDYDRTHIAFGKGSTWSALAKVTQIKPKGPYQVGIEAVVDDPSVHTADMGVTVRPVRYSSLRKVLTRPVMKPFFARLDALDANRVVLSWEPVPGAVAYHIEMAEGADPAVYTGSWTRVADTTSTVFTIALVSPSRTMMRIRAVNLTAGDWVAASLGSLLARFWNTNGSVPIWTSGAAAFWRPL